MHARGTRVIWTLVAIGIALSATGCTKQARKKRAIARADQDFAAEKYDRAEIEYLSALRVPPPDPAALVPLARIYYMQGKFPQAYGLLQKAVQLQSGNAETHARFAQACLAMNRNKGAREQALMALDKQPQNREALLALVESTSGTNQVTETLKRLEAVPQADRNGAAYHVALGTLHLRLRELDRAGTEFTSALKDEPKCVEAHLGLGAISLSRSNLTAAESAFKAAADVAPIRSSSRLKYADLKVKTGAREVARKTVEEITAVAPDYLPAWLFLAQLAYADQRAEECSKMIDIVLARDAVNLEALLMKGNYFLAASDPTNALAQFGRIETVYGKIPAVRYRMALAYLQNRETVRARNTLDELLFAQPNFPEAVLLNASLQIRAGDAVSAAAALTKLLKEQPRYFQAHVYLAEAYLTQRKTVEAAQVYQQMSSLFPKSPEVYILQGSLFLQQGKRAEARNAYERALEIMPDSLPALERLIDMDVSERNFKEASGRVGAQIAARPASAEPWLFSAKVHIAQALDLAGATNTIGSEQNLRPHLAASPEALGEMAKAESALEKAIELRPALALSHMLLAQLYVNTGRQQQALGRLEILASTNSPGALLQIALIHAELKNYHAARAAYEKMILHNPRESAALNNLAYLYTEHLGNLDKAYEMAQKARDLLPHDPRTADTLGWVLYRRADYERALSLLQEAAMRLTLDPEVQMHLGMAHYSLGEEGAARVALERAVQSGKDFPGKVEARRRLDLLQLDVNNADAATLAELRQRAAQEPDDVVLVLRVAELNERNSRYAEARDAYQNLIRTNPRNGRVQFRLAALLGNHLNDPAKAMDLAKSAHLLLPEDAEISTLLGRLAFRQREYEWALSLFQAAARKLPEKADLAYDLGKAFYSVGSVAEAESLIQKTLASGSFSQETEARTFLKLVSSARDLGQARAALAEARALVQKQPDNVPALMLIALMQEEGGDYAGAQSSYEKVLSVFPLFIPATKSLALCAFKLGNEDSAYEHATKARAALPQDPDIARTLGILSFRRSETERATQLLNEAARQKPDDAELQFYLGMAHYHLKQVLQSTRSLQRALELKLEPKLAAEARQKLSELNKSL